MTVDAEGPGAPIWYRETGTTSTGLRLAEAWTSDEHRDGSYTAAAPQRASLVWRTTATDDGLLHVNIPPARAPDVPPLWFVPIDELRGDDPGCSLVAYLDDGVPPGTVVSLHTLATLGVPSDSQVGTVRWLRTGLVVELYVARDYRMRDIGLSLVHAAGAWHQANRWPGFLYADTAAAPPGSLAPVARRHPSRVRDTSVPDPAEPAAPLDPPKRRWWSRRR